MNRRELIARAIVLACGGIVASCVRPVAIASKLTGEHMAQLDTVAATLLPATQTPGAIGAGVPAFLRKMIETWASSATLTSWGKVLDRLDAAAVSSCAQRFMKLVEADRHAVLASFDRVSIAADDTAYITLKELILTGYYLSEVGATRELHYELVPGVWQSCVPLSADSRTWAQ